MKEIFDWQNFLNRWNGEMLASEIGSQLPASVRATGWLGALPATDKEIRIAERRLKIELPPSYKSFLKISNGWGRTTFAIDRLLPVQEVNWFRKTNRDWIGAFSEPSMYGPLPEIPNEEYFAYGQWVEAFRREHFKETLQISGVDDGVYLLNPQVITKDGEWEAWFFANWIPGAHRYRSFEELMQGAYHSFVGTEWKQPVGVVGALPDEYVGAPGSVKRRLKVRGPVSKEHVLSDLLEGITNPEVARRLFPRAFLRMLSRFWLSNAIVGSTKELRHGSLFGKTARAGPRMLRRGNGDLGNRQAIQSQL